MKSGPTSLHFKQITHDVYESPLGTSYGLELLTNGETRVNLDDREEMLFNTNGLTSATRLVVDTTTSYDTVYAYTTNGLLLAVTNANGHYV